MRITKGRVDNPSHTSLLVRLLRLPQKKKRMSFSYGSNWKLSLIMESVHQSHGVNLYIRKRYRFSEETTPLKNL